MSVEISGFDGSNTRLVGTVSDASREVLLAQGVAPGVAATSGVIGAEYAAAVLFTALESMGHWPPEGFDEGEFELVVRSIVSRSMGRG